MRSSRLEAPITMTFFSVSTPSISASSCGTIVDSMSEQMPVPRVRNSESISSKKTMTGRALLGLLPGPLEDQADLALGLAHVLVEQLGALDVEEVAAGLASPVTSATFLARELATALAMSVLPQPGGPVEQDALGGRELVLGEQVLVQERQLDGVGDLLDLARRGRRCRRRRCRAPPRAPAPRPRAAGSFSSSRPERVSISTVSPARSLVPTEVVGQLRDTLLVGPADDERPAAVVEELLEGDDLAGALAASGPSRRCRTR